ncbi:hypothetical protein MMC17_008797 [Xylographa soralifera]|nr:hypothetical protein [Xylographa soralifera]
MGSDDKPAKKRRTARSSRSHHRDDDSYEFDTPSSSKVQLNTHAGINEDNPNAVPRRARHTSKTVEQGVAEGQPRLSNVLNHGWHMQNWVPRFSWKCVLVFFVGIYCCLVFMSHLFAHSRKFARSYWGTTVCSREVPLLITNVIVGNWMPGCSSYNNRTEQPVSPLNHTKMVTIQEELGRVASQVGQSFELTKKMVNSEFTIRDLKIRVVYSKLLQKDGLTKELVSISQSTKIAYRLGHPIHSQLVSDKLCIRYMSRFTVKYNKLIDRLEAYNRRAISDLGHLRQRRRNPTFLAQIVSATTPMTLFGYDLNEDQAKEMIFSIAAKISADVQPLLEQSQEISYTLDQITGALDEIGKMTIEELGALPRHQRLRAIWDQMSPNKDYALFKSHASLLEELVHSHEIVSAVMKYTITALLRVEAELESIHDDYATPALIMQDDPFHDAQKTFELSTKRLIAAKSGLDQGENRLELGGRA